MAAMKIRRAVIADIPAVMQIESVSFAPQIQESEETFVKRVTVFPDGFYVLEKEGTVCGYLTCEIWAENSIDGDSFLLGHDIAEKHSEKGTVLYVSSLALLPEHRSRGDGSKFFWECIGKIVSLYPEINKSVLIVNENWNSARRIYFNSGYRETDRMENFFFDGDAIVMEKNYDRSAVEGFFRFP